LIAVRIRLRNIDPIGVAADELIVGSRYRRSPSSPIPGRGVCAGRVGSELIGHHWRILVAREDEALVFGSRQWQFALRGRLQQHLMVRRLSLPDGDCAGMVRTQQEGVVGNAGGVRQHSEPFLEEARQEEDALQVWAAPDPRIR
jgi:hypothetical protein